MPIVHGVNLSPFVRKVRVALAEKGIDYELVPVMPFGQTEEYRRKSPLGKIPCYEEDGYLLPDSSCILAYLERRTPKPALYPEEAREFGRALWYEEYADSKLVEVATPVFFERVVKPSLLEQEVDEERVRKTLAEDQPPVFDYLEAEVRDREFLAGGRFSVADIAVASPFVNLLHGGEQVDASRWPRLAAYLERILSRPSFKGLLEEEKASASQLAGA
jgi:glutathione S-transferase